MKVTPNQKDVLLRLCRLSVSRAVELTDSPRPGRWISVKECGQSAALDHLFYKGFVDREVRIDQQDLVEA